MNANAIISIISVIGLLINLATMFITFPAKRGYLFTIGILIPYTAAATALLHISGFLFARLPGLRGIIFLPVILWLFRGQIFQKTFAFFLQYFLTLLQSTLAMAVVELFVPRGGDAYYVIYTVILLIMFAGYITLVLKFGRRVFQRLFAGGQQSEWALYAAGSVFSFMILTMLRYSGVDGWLYILLLLFMLWSFTILCFAIINTHEKTKKTAEAELAAGVISSGRDHYQKMDEMYNKLRILSHDYKYHLSVARKMLGSDDSEGAGKYLTSVENKLAEVEMKTYCSNKVIDALVNSYAERCARLGVRFDVDINIPESLGIPNYDLCIILGNLLENAVEACEKLEHGRLIKLETQSIRSQLLFMVKNSYDGTVYHDDGTPLSTKTSAGFGLRSVKEVIARNDGDLSVEWNDETFTAYVAVRA